MVAPVELAALKMCYTHATLPINAGLAHILSAAFSKMLNKKSSLQ